MKQIVMLIVAFAIVGGVNLQTASAHKIFKTEMGKKYEADKVKVKSCNACHVKRAKKTERNEFGKLFTEHEAFKGKEFSKRHHDAHEAEDDAAEEAVEAEMIAAFKLALADIEKMEKDGVTYEELIKTYQLDEIVELEDDDE